MSVDHITPVVSVDDGFLDFNTFIARLFCDASNLQVICDEDHQNKTNAERAERNRKKALQELQDLALKLAQMPLTAAQKELKRFLTAKKHADVRACAVDLKTKLEEKTQTV